MATNVTLPDAQALRAVARYEREHHKSVAPQKPAPSPERKSVVRPPHFEPGTSPEEKRAALLAAGFLEEGRSENGNPLFRHPENPKGYAPFELYTKKRSAERAPVERPRRSAQEMLAVMPTKPEPVRVTADGQVVPADGKHTHKRRKVHGRPHLTQEDIDRRKAARAAAKQAPKAKKDESANTDKSKSKPGGKNKNGTPKKK